MKNNIRVLLVDDEEDFLAPVSFWLNAKGYTVQTASNGQQAVAAVRHEAPDIMFLDLQMPVLGGLDTLKQVRTITKDLPVIIVTAVYQESATIESAVKLGVSGFFPKQSSLSDLVGLIEPSLRAHAKLNHHLPTNSPKMTRGEE